MESLDAVSLLAQLHIATELCVYPGLRWDDCIVHVWQSWSMWLFPSIYGVRGQVQLFAFIIYCIHCVPTYLVQMRYNIANLHCTGLYETNNWPAEPENNPCPLAHSLPDIVYAVGTFYHPAAWTSAKLVYTDSLLFSTTEGSHPEPINLETKVP